MLLKIAPLEGLDFKSVSLLVPESPSSLSSLPASRDQKSEQSNDKSKTEPKVKSDGLTSKASRLTDPGATPTATPAPMKTQSETVGEYFRGCLSISLLTAGELDDGCCFEDKNLLEQLQECMTEAVAAKADRPFCGNITCAALMGDTMNLLLETYERKVPAPWVPVMRLLREQPPKKPSKKVKDILSRAATRPIVRLVPEDFHIKNGCERCEDEIWRAESDRTAQGFTVKDTYVAPANGKTYNIWRKVKV